MRRAASWGDFLEDEVGRREHPAPRMHLDAGRIEGTEMVPRSLRVHVAHQELRRVPGFRDDQEGGETDATRWNLRDTECRGVSGLAETRESPVRRHARSEGP